MSKARVLIAPRDYDRMPLRHCARSDAIQSPAKILDCFGAYAPRNDAASAPQTDVLQTDALQINMAVLTSDVSDISGSNPQSP